MSDSRSPGRRVDEPTVRLELTTAEVRQVFALYARPQRSTPPGARPPQAATESSLGARLRELRPLAWRWRGSVALCCVAAMALGVGYLLLATPTFCVTARVLVEHRGARAGAGAAAIDAGAFLRGQAEMLRDASLVREGLIRSRSGVSGDELASLGRLSQSPARPVPSSEDADRVAVARALAAFSARAVYGTEVIALEYRTQDPASGVRFVQAMIDGYAQLVRGLGSGDAGVAVRTLAAPTRQGSPLWPRPLPVLLASLLVGLVAGLGLAVLAERAQARETAWPEIREAAWAG